MASSFTPNKSIEQPTAGSYNDTWATPVNANWEDIDNALAGHTEIDITGVGAGAYTFTLAQYQPPNIAFIGTWSAILVYLFPPGTGWLGTIYNSTSGAIIVGATSGSSVTIPSGQRYAIVSDGVNLGLQQSPVNEGPPTALVGLTPVVGANGTVMDSGSAPALNTTISPTWTGTHTFDALVVLAGDCAVNSEMIVGAGVPLIVNGTLTTPTPPFGDNSTNAANTAFVQTAIAPKAPLVSPAFTGSPTAPTPAAGDSSTNIATTAFINPAGSATLGTTGSAALPNGLILKWGSVANGGSGNTPISFVTAFPNACFGVQTTSTGVEADTFVNSYNSIGFHCSNGAGGSTTLWFAYGW